ncbi:MAG: hypothetical protein QXR30_01390 [Candidatus Woesearchaeota archaeon]
MFNNFVTKNDFQALKDSLRKSFSNLKAEMDEHLDAINQNVNEIQHLYEIISSLEIKMDKMIERIEFLENQSLEQSKNFSDDEKKIFQTLYLLNEMQYFVPISSLIKKLELDFFTIEALINSLIAKGITIEKHIKNGELCYSISKEIKEKQAKENILNIQNKIFDI